MGQKVGMYLNYCDFFSFFLATGAFPQMSAKARVPAKTSTAPSQCCAGNGVKLGEFEGSYGQNKEDSENP